MFRALGKLLTSSAVKEDVLQHWSTLEIDQRRVDVFDSGEEQPAGCVLFLHGHGGVGLTENSVFSNLFHDHRLIAVCPEGGRSWWLDRVCPEFDPEMSPVEWLQTSVLPFIDSRWQISAPRIALLGVSMGGQGALQLAYQRAREYPVVAALSPAVDFHQLYGQGLPLDSMYDSLEDARQDTAVLNLHPLAWPRHQFFCCDPADTDWFDGCSRLAMKLSSSGIMYERDLTTSAGGHSWDYFNHMAPTAVEHIAKGLASVSEST